MTGFRILQTTNRAVMISKGSASNQLHSGHSHSVSDGLKVSCISNSPRRFMPGHSIKAAGNKRNEGLLCSFREHRYTMWALNDKSTHTAVSASNYNQSHQACIQVYTVPALRVDELFLYHVLDIFIQHSQPPTLPKNTFTHQPKILQSNRDTT